MTVDLELAEEVIEGTTQLLYGVVYQREYRRFDQDLQRLTILRTDDDSSIHIHHGLDEYNESAILAAHIKTSSGNRHPITREQAERILTKAQCDNIKTKALSRTGQIKKDAYGSPKNSGECVVL